MVPLLVHHARDVSRQLVQQACGPVTSAHGQHRGGRGIEEGPAKRGPSLSVGTGQEVARLVLEPVRGLVGGEVQGHSMRTIGLKGEPVPERGPERVDQIKLGG